ncbi:DUF6538 domain-containing protein [Sphingopyxis flava]|uniref:DUF6538 domain-containing protein n=1 Tax=Sphingopyxis flava TaxID=1507287 RepID=UPI003CCC221E
MSQKWAGTADFRHLDVPTGHNSVIQRGMEKMADMQRLLKRGDTYHYHRRVPLHLVDIVGKKFVRRALGTDSPKEARRRRTLEDARCAASYPHPYPLAPSAPTRLIWRIFGHQAGTFHAPRRASRNILPLWPRPMPSPRSSVE